MGNNANIETYYMIGKPIMSVLQVDSGSGTLESIIGDISGFMSQVYHAGTFPPMLDFIGQGALLVSGSGEFGEIL